MSESTVAAEACEAIAAGPWCFLDRFGPATFAQGGGMDVAPHPHIGLQTVTWLLDGETVHDDSLEQEALLRPVA